MSKIIKHIELSKLGRSLLEGDVIRPKENIFGFTANRNYVVRKDEGITCLYIKSNYGKITGVYNLDLDNWLLEQTEDNETLYLALGDVITPKENFRCFTKGKQYLVMESTLGGNIPYIVNDVGVHFKVTDLEIDRYFIKVKDACGEVFDHIEEGNYITPRESYSVFKKGDNHKIFMDDERNAYILDEEEKKHYLYRMNLSLWEKSCNFLLNLKVGDKITPLMDMLDFTEGTEYEVDNLPSYTDVLFIFSDKGRAITIASLTPKLWSKVKEPENPFIMRNSDSANVITLGKEEFSGGSVNYYRVDIAKPLSDDLDPCTVEFEDIALALGLEPMEYNIMKELWRTANARTNGLRKKGHNTKYGREKVLHYAKLLHKLEEQ